MAGLPWGVAGKPAPVFVREAPRGDELHYAGFVKQQDRCTLTAQRLDDRVEGGFMDIPIRAGSVQPVGEPEQGCGLTSPFDGRIIFDGVHTQCRSGTDLLPGGAPSAQLLITGSGSKGSRMRPQHSEGGAFRSESAL